MKELLIALFFSTPQAVDPKKEPCNTDFTVLKLETRVKLGMACSKAMDLYTIRPRSKRQEILDNDKAI